MRTVKGMGKRGMEDKLAFTMWELMVILMVVIALTVSVRGIANNTVYWKKYHSADLALMTDLLMINQGDSIINYELKDVDRNALTNTLAIDPLRLHIVLTGNGYQVYDGPIDEDRFPQNYIFGADIDVKIINSDITSDYVILYKEGRTFSLRNDYIAKTIECPTIITKLSKEDILKKHFDTLATSKEFNNHASYVKELLKNVGRGQDNELFIGFASSGSDSIVIYYDSKIASDKSKAEKIACILMKHILTDNPDLKITIRPYDSSQLQNTNVFNDLRITYHYSILIQLNTMSDSDIGKYISESIGEYYS